MNVQSVIVDSQGTVLHIIKEDNIDKTEIVNIEVPNDIEENKKFYVYDGSGFTIDQNMKTEYENKKVLLEELEALEKWFDGYDIQCNQYRRSTELGIDYDRDIVAMHEQAEIKKVRINEIRIALQV